MTRAGAHEHAAKPARRRRLVALAVVVGLVALVVAVVTIAVVDTTQPRLTTYRIPVRGPEAPVRILLVSDVHSRTFGEGQAKVAEALRDAPRYDVAIFAGDEIAQRSERSPLPKSGLFSPGRGNLDPQPAYDLLGIVQARTDGPVVFVPGNHDDQEVLDGLAERGAIDLRSGSMELTSGVVLRPGPAAVSDFATMTAGPWGGSIVMYVQHNPPTDEQLDAAAAIPSWQRIIVAGHTHGGQIVLPLIGAVWAPLTDNLLDNLFPDLRGKQIRGSKKTRGARVIISQGLGSIELPVRFLAPSEIVSIELSPARP